MGKYYNVFLNNNICSSNGLNNRFKGVIRSFGDNSFRIICEEIDGELYDIITGCEICELEGEQINENNTKYDFLTCNWKVEMTSKEVVSELKRMNNGIFSKGNIVRYKRAMKKVRRYNNKCYNEFNGDYIREFKEKVKSK